MRPINLIPPEERRSHGTTTRTGPLAYIIVGALGVALIGVVMLALTANTISDRKDEVSSLEAERSAVSARAAQLAPYASFQQVAEARTQTISALADSRFNWPSVIRQLSLILPPNVYLKELTGSAGGGSTEGASEIAGPSLNISGCAQSQNTVAALVAALKEIDGVTRVRLGYSTANEGGGGSAEAKEYCALPGIPQFEVIVAFDGAPPGPDGGAVAAEPAPEESSGESEEEPAEGGEGSEEGESEGASSAPSASAATGEEAG